MTIPVYATVEEVREAPDFRATARSDRHVLRVLEGASRSIDGVCHRRFYPELDTRTFDWPNEQRAASWRLWLDHNELASDSGVTLVAGGVTIPSADYFLRPDNGPPFTHIEIDLGGNSAFGSIATHQRSISITGLFGYRADEEPAGALAEALDASETAVDVTDSSLVGIGDLIRVGSERMVVVGKAMVSTTATLTGSEAAAQNDTTIAVDDGTKVKVGETVLVDAERMLVTDVAGNNLVVRRAWDGSTLAAHSGGTVVYAPRTLTVERGSLGTSAATHSLGATISRHVPPGAVNSMAVALATFQFHQELISYSSTTGGQLGQSTRETKGRALELMWDQLRTTVGRKGRTRAA